MTEGYAAIPNWIVRDSEASLYAVAVYVALASHSGPGGIHPSQETIAREARCSPRSVRSALVELEELGVVERVRRKSAKGRDSDGYRLHPHGRLNADEVVAPAAGTGEVVAPDARGSGTPGQVIPLIEEKPKEEGVPDLFEEFWKIWPRKEAKKRAAQAWRSAIKREHPEVILGCARLWVQSPEHAEVRFIPWASSWLNADRWTDPVELPASAPAREEVW